MGALVVAGCLIVAPTAASAQSNEDCLVCHGTKDILSLSQEEREAQVAPSPPDLIVGPKEKELLGDLSLFVDPEFYDSSVHGSLECIACHMDIEEILHPSKLQAVNCGLCHDEVGERESQSGHGQALAKGSADAPLCQDCHGAHNIQPPTDASSPMYPLNQSGVCSKCHKDREMMLRAGVGIPTAAQSYEASIHYQALQGGNLKAPTCNSCHQSHGVLPSWNPLSSVFWANQSHTCGTCHTKISQDYEESVHGKGVTLGNPDFPTCSSCHNAHLILSKNDKRSPSYPTNISRLTCPQCHASEKIIRRYGLRPDSVKSYDESYHGLASKFGDTTVANCAACHGAHETRKSTDPKSRINPSNLVATCSQCHPGATPRFASTPIHVSAVKTPTIGSRIQHWVRIFYWVLIPLVIGFMLFHNITDYLKKVRIHYDKWKAEGNYLRMSLNERLQHFVLIVAFSLLVLSGFSLSFQWQIPFIGGEFAQKLRFYVHRIAAVIFMAYFLYHLLWVPLTKRGRGIIRDLIPHKSDLRDLIGALRYNLGLARTKPGFGRFSYMEKMEYWAMIWGGALMIITGSILWFKKEATAIFPPWFFTVANIIHYYEALLATLAVFVWHFYSVMGNPDISPMAMHWLTGRLPEDVLKEEYRLEWERWKASQQAQQD
jgi:cytochrome b subunit of formate dehydrogenase